MPTKKSVVSMLQMQHKKLYITMNEVFAQTASTPIPL